MNLVSGGYSPTGKLLVLWKQYLEAAPANIEDHHAHPYTEIKKKYSSCIGDPPPQIISSTLQHPGDPPPQVISSTLHPGDSPQVISSTLHDRPGDPPPQIISSTLILVILFFVAKEIYLWINPFKDEDGVSHKGHVLGALAGIGFGYLVIYYWDDSHLKDFKKS